MATQEEFPAILAPTAGPPLYRREDYVGAARHLLIFAVDGAVVFLVLLPFTSIVAILGGTVTGLPALFFPWIPLLCIWSYLAVLKPSRYRSLGYWVADAKIVTIHGKPPSPFRMTLRLLWTFYWWLSVPGFLVDFFWATANRERQMIRDLLAETRLVRNRAQPIGVGKISHALMTGWGVAVLYAEVREPTMKP